jgi:hypothetical protein
MSSYDFAAVFEGAREDGVSIFFGVDFGVAAGVAGASAAPPPPLAIFVGAIHVGRTSTGTIFRLA